ncbi:hypothetical protein BT63DRAFT_413382 [Microthyrium microscopicum]|uniref:Extracellular membrane protein CFEM domain-containing protein n=1 Tax=Microthyrium microscopicum TaxID=703497 RepID=A0A6A6UGA0_9PEZI|nr:hypothetical protein BT63DRAFT_413382 [Microthyrium microscopicum]
MISTVIFSIAMASQVMAQTMAPTMPMPMAAMPAQCNTICKPVMELMTGCMATKTPVSAMAEKCVCSNTSFDVASIGGLCMSCIMMNKSEDEAMMQVGMKCPFEEGTYTPQVDSLAKGIMVKIPPMDMSSGSMSSMPGMTMPGMTGTMPGMSMPSGMSMSSGNKAVQYSGALAFVTVALAWILS